jgi:ATP phosphoribosyltransferase
MTIKFALPTGDNRASVHSLLERAGVDVPGYEPGSRTMRNESAELVARIFRERDIPVQVATGNYDLGICSATWLAEVQARFPMQHVVQVGTLRGPRQEVWVCAGVGSGAIPGYVPEARSLAGAWIASELPNLADQFAVRHRIPGYRLLPIAGSADAYPPDDAELVVVPAAPGTDFAAVGLVPLERLFDGGLALIANSDGLSRRNLGGVLSRLAAALDGAPSTGPAGVSRGGTLQRSGRRRDVVRVAVPDGHAQRHGPAALEGAGIVFPGYAKDTRGRRPAGHRPGVEVKVVRPQDMPQLVALGAFDLALTGRDVLTDHLTRFPTSPIAMAVDLKLNWYRIGPVVEGAFPCDTTPPAVERWKALRRPVRIAAEMSGLAELFARTHGLTQVEIMPIAGASEGFVPEDADILIEGTETGSSLRANNLKMLDTLMESTLCAIWRTEPVTERVDILHDMVDALRSSTAGATGE